MRALGIHVFAGGFTMGVQRRAEVVAQLEIHNFGRETVEQLGVPFINCEHWEDWPTPTNVDFVYGNPRCTGFSCITSGYGDETHGPWAKQTKDVHDLCEYGVRLGAPVIIWESVQQAYSVGRPLLDHLRDEVFAPQGYRVAHVFVNAASFGNCQTRRRYFFVAYRGGNFNIAPPTLPPRHATLRDVIGHLRERETRVARLTARGTEYDGDCYTDLTADEWRVVPHLPPRCGLNEFARRFPEKLERVCPRFADAWYCRMSEMPFSFHCVARTGWDWRCPTLFASSGRLIHPELHRPLTVRELATIMGWGDVLPQGWNPVAQIGKGVVPAVGTWLAEQVDRFIHDPWDDDWSTRYDHRAGRWVGEHLVGEPTDKVLDMTHYFPPLERREDHELQ